MQKNFTQYAFTPTVKKLQENAGSRRGYERMETSGDRFLLGVSEIAFIASRDSFYLSTVGENGWPYVQHRGGPIGFLKVVDATTLRFADYSGNRQFISAGNVADNQKACLFLIDYPNRQRLKIWAHATLQFVKDDPELLAEFADDDSRDRIERVFTLSIQGFDWNCPKFITPRFTFEQLKQEPELIQQLINQ